MRIDILTIFPGMFAGAGPLGASIIGRAVERGAVDLRVHDLRDWTTDRHRSIDDYPYGGGAGMVMKAPPVVAAVEAVLGEDAGREPRVPVLLMSAAGRPFTQEMAHALANQERFVLLCAHYEGVDERAITLAVTDEVSIGDYVLTGGELPAMVVTDTIVRLLPGVIEAESLAEESFAAGLLEYPHYTRPPEFRSHTVPDVLTSGNHAQIARWRREQALLRTRARRPDLLASAPLTPADRRFLAAHPEFDDDDDA
jgi:tRNA (guanine37-N1)-methyltransferase